MSTRIHTLVVCIAMAMTLTHRSTAQEFEVTDIHASSGLPSIHLPMLNSSMRSGQSRHGRYEMRSATVTDLIGAAWHIDTDKIVGGPAWINTDLFDVIAQMPPDTAPASLRPMLQSMLAGRFALSTHPDTRPLPGLAITAGNHPQLKASSGGDSGCRGTTQKGTATPSGAIQIVSVSCQNVTMAEFAGRLSQVASAYLGSYNVTDMTGLSGNWDFTFKMTARNWLSAAGPEGISLSDALEKQLGLKLETRDIPTPVLVVDKVSRPTANSPDVAAKLPELPMKFEVADIKPTPPEMTQRNFRSQPGGLVEIRGFTVGELIRMAWEITDLDAIDHEDLLTGAPNWPERFDIVARAAAPDRLDSFSVQTLLRALLEDRFGLQSHIAKRTVTVDALTAVKPKLTKANPESRMGCHNAPSPAGSAWTFTVVCRNTTMAHLAENLPAYGASYIVHPVIDDTGLEGGWDFTLNWSPPHLVKTGDESSASDPNGALTIPEALEKQLGLKLETKKHPMDVLVIDHVERMPTAN